MGKVPGGPPVALASPRVIAVPAAAGLVVGLLLLGFCPAAARAQTEVVEYYGVDALGSIRVVFDGGGAVLARTDYLPFGENLDPSGALPPWQFTGQIRDGEAGQDDFGARRYQPRHGRFTAVDPVYAGLFDPQQWNRYGYARNSPLVSVDPDGRALLAVADLRTSRDRRVPRTRNGECGEGPVDLQLTSLFGAPTLGLDDAREDEPPSGLGAAVADAVSLEPAADLGVMAESSGTDANPRSCRQELAAWRVCVQECREAKWGEAIWDGAYSAAKNTGGCWVAFLRTRAAPSAAQVGLFAVCIAGTGYADAMNTWNKAATFGESCTQKCGPSPTCIGAP